MTCRTASSVARRPASTRSSGAVDPPPPLTEQDIEKAINGSLPTRPGERNRRLFELVRRLKGLGVLDRPPAALRPIVNAWWKKAKLRTSGRHTADDCWFEFLTAIKKVRSPWGANPMQDVLEQVRTGQMPDVARDYEDLRVQALIAMCAALQAQAPPGEPFFLSSHQAAKVLQTHPMETYRWLQGLCLAGVLEEVEKGSNRKATRYRYLAGDSR